MSKKRRQIIALGGGGFSMEPWNPLLDLYILENSGIEKPKICFVPTASGDSDSYVERFYKSMQKLECLPAHLSLFKGQAAAIEEFLLQQDIIYVGGGNTRNLLTLWREWGVDHAIRKAYERGTVLAGISAGSICWFEQGVTDSVPGKLSSLNCLGLLKGSNCPHYDGESERRPSYQRLLANGEISGGIATEDGVALHFVDESLFRVVSSHPERRAYSLTLRAGLVQEQPLDADYLGGKALLIRRAALADALAIHQAHMQSIQENCAQDYSPEQIEAWGNRPYGEEKVQAAIRQDLVWVVERAGLIAGFGHLRFLESSDTAVGLVNGLYFTKEVQGLGLGRALMELMIAAAREKNVMKLELESTINAHAFYQHLGFANVGKMQTKEMRGVQIPCIPMVLTLR